MTGVDLDRRAFRGMLDRRLDSRVRARNPDRVRTRGTTPEDRTQGDWKEGRAHRDGGEQPMCHGFSLASRHPIRRPSNGASWICRTGAPCRENDLELARGAEGGKGTIRMDRRRRDRVYPGLQSRGLDVRNEPRVGRELRIDLRKCGAHVQPGEAVLSRAGTFSSVDGQDYLTARRHGSIAAKRLG